MAIEKYFQYIESEKRFSPHTIVAYRNDILEFRGFLEEEFEINDINQASAETIRSWIVSLLDSGLSPTSINRKISTLRSYFKFQLSRNLIKSNPALQVMAVKQSERLPKYINQDDLNELLNSFSPNNFIESREKIVVELLYSSGIRLSELISLKYSSINKSLNTVKVLGKRNKERLIPLSEKTQLAIEDYNYFKLKELPTAEDWLIVTNKGKKAYPKMIYRIVDNALNNITKGKRSPHTLRHSFATHMLNNGADLNTIKELLGHSSLAATQVYTHNTIEQLKTIYSNAHPRAKFKKGG
ncbi:MAG: integrase [Marinilabiliales bacterium]|nr:MAG: integrase [Marinilabiliales bacterium]